MSGAEALDEDKCRFVWNAVLLIRKGNNIVIKEKRQLLLYEIEFDKVL